MSVLTPGWELKVERGPDCLWVRVGRLHPDCLDDPPLADEVWALLERHFVYRLVLELDEIELVNSFLLGQLVVLHKRLRERGGMLRLSGLSRLNQEVLRVHGLDGRFAVYSSRADAVMGGSPRRPR
jgi:hypothetical protein